MRPHGVVRRHQKSGRCVSSPTVLTQSSRPYLQQLVTEYFNEVGRYAEQCTTEKNKTAYDSVKGILSTHSDKAPHIIVAVQRPLTVTRCGHLSEDEWHGTGREVSFVFFSSSTWRLARDGRPAPCVTAHSSAHTGHHSATGLPHRGYMPRLQAPARRQGQNFDTLKLKLGYVQK